MFMSTAAVPGLDLPSESRRRREARTARRRLYPVSVLYSVYSLAVLGITLARASHPAVPLLFFATGALVWTLLEYFVHRYVLHGRFPDGDGLLRHLLHKYFDHLHLEHHARPWDGNHVSGTIRDTLPFATLLALLSYVAPLSTLPVFIAGVLQSYIVEEWVHHSVHFCDFKGRYFKYIRRHHLYHHSPKGSEVGYGLTSAFWDVVWQTRIPAAERQVLYAQKRPARRRRRLRCPLEAPVEGQNARHPDA
jgi:sterol desaturase/sphingolipid hydroxylase (fatty acid hydroxylase superfamily)